LFLSAIRNYSLDTFCLIEHKRRNNLVEIFALWLPILISAAAVFVVSSFIHMAVPWHKGDYRKMPDEDKLMDALRTFNIPPGDYLLPCADNMKHMQSVEFKNKIEKGPIMIATIRPAGNAGMGLNLFLWLIYSVVIGIIAAYVSSRALVGSAVPLQIFRFVGVTSFLGYSGALWQMSIWYRRSWMTTLKSSIDGLIYACVTAAIFVWLWP